MIIIKNPNKQTISTWVATGIANRFDDIAEQLGLSRSQFVEDAIYHYATIHSDIDLKEEYPEIHKLVKNKEKYTTDSIDRYFIEKERQHEVHGIKAATFFDHVDKHLGEIYKRNSRHMSNEKMEEIMTAYLDSLQDRCEFYQDKFDFMDFEKRMEWRYDDPIKYASQKLEDLRKEENIEGEN